MATKIEEIILPDVMREPVMYEGKKKWLFITKGEEIIDSGRKIKDIAKNPIKAKIVNKFSLKEPFMWQCKVCGGFEQSNPNEPYECTGCKRTTSFRRYTKEVKDGVWRIPNWIDLPKEKIDMKKTFEDQVSLLKKCSVMEDEIQHELLALWNISTYKPECWDAVGWPLFLGLPNSGKSWMLDLLAALGHRIIPAYSATFPGVVRQGHSYMAGFCMDEIQTKFDSRTEDGKKWLTFIKPSYRRGNTYMVADPVDPYDSIIYRNYGFKALAGEYCKDYALSTRCFPFNMQEDTPEIGEMKYVTDEIDKLKTILINYRYKTDEPPDLGMDFCIKPGRIKEIFCSIISTAMHIGIDPEPYIEYAKNIKEERSDELKNSLENEILNAIHELTCQSKLSDAPETLPYDDIRNAMGWEESKESTKSKLNKKIGFSLRNILGLKVRRGKYGWVLIINDERNTRKLKVHYRKYGVG